MQTVVKSLKELKSDYKLILRQLECRTSVRWGRRPMQCGREALDARRVECVCDRAFILNRFFEEKSSSCQPHLNANEHWDQGSTDDRLA